MVMAGEFEAEGDIGTLIRVCSSSDQLFAAWRSPNRFAANGRRRITAMEATQNGRVQSVPVRRAILLWELGFHLLKWRLAEQQFWILQRGKECCTDP